MRTTSDIARTAVYRPATGERSIEPLPATVGDQAEIKQFLASVLQRPSPREFQAQLDDPFYEPSDRLLVKRDHQIVAHLLMTWRTICFGQARWPLCNLSYLGLMPHRAPVNACRRLLDAAQRQMAEVGSVVAEMTVNRRWIDADDSWAPCGRYVCSQASPRDILAELSQCQVLDDDTLLPDKRQKKRQPLKLRLWRQVELPALMRIYNANLSATPGALERSEAYWRWLISRGAFDQIYVAIEGDDKLSLEEGECKIVGYAIIKDQNVLELMADPEYPNAVNRLLARACHDAIEQDWHVVRLHAPPADPNHAIIGASGGGLHQYTTEHDMVTLVRISDPAEFVKSLSGELQQRAVASGLRLPVELGFLTGRRKWQLTVSKDGAKLVSGRLGRSYVTCDQPTMVRLLMGYQDATSSAAEGRLDPSTALAEEMAAALFPRVTIWRPPWDGLAA